MGNYPQTGYDYSRAGIAMVTLKAGEGMRFCNISATIFQLTPPGKLLQGRLRGLNGLYPQMKVGIYQIMPDHVHFMLHVVKNLPPLSNWLTILDDLRSAWGAEARAQNLMPADVQTFSSGCINHSLVFKPEQLQREVAYIKDNVRRYRVMREYPDLFSKAAPLRNIASLEEFGLWRYGNGFLLDKPVKVFVQTHRVMPRADLEAMEHEAMRWIGRGAVFVSPFIAPGEQRIKDLAIENGCSLIQLTDRETGPRYKPVGRNFDLCAEGRLLELSAAGFLGGHQRPTITRDRCLQMNAIAERICEGNKVQSGYWRGG